MDMNASAKIKKVKVANFFIRLFPKILTDADAVEAIRTESTKHWRRNFSCDLFGNQLASHRREQDSVAIMSCRVKESAHIRARAHHRPFVFGAGTQARP